MGDERGRIFQEKYGSLFEKMSQIPPEERWEYFSSNQDLYASFFSDMLVILYPEAKEQNDEGFYAEHDRELNVEAFVKALQKAVVLYEPSGYHTEEGTREMSASFYTFFNTIYKNYNHKYYEEKRQKKNITRTMMRLIRAIQDEKKNYENRDMTVEKIIQEKGRLFEERKICKIFKEDGKLAEVPVKVIEYLDFSVISYDSEMGFEPAGRGLSIEDKVMEQDILERMQRNREDVKEYIENLVEGMKGKPVDWSWYRAFWTQDIMKVLKLCNGTPYETCPAGNTEYYEEVRAILSDSWGSIVFMDYIEKIIEDKPENVRQLYGQYYNLLRDRKRNIGTDSILAEILGESQTKVNAKREKNKNNYLAWRKKVDQKILEISKK